MGLFEKVAKIAVAATGVASNAVSKIASFGKPETVREQLNLPKGYSVQIQNDTFDLSEIHHYYLENREYIYLPVYEETEKVSSIFRIRSREYRFVERYYPFASILNEKTKRPDFSGFKSDSTLLNISKEIVQSTSDVICDLKDYLNNNSSEIKHVNCIDCEGKRFNVNLHELPNRVIRNNQEILLDSIEGKFTKQADVEIKMVPCLIIEADKYYYYFGDGINYDDVSVVYKILDDRINMAVADINAQNEEKLKTVNNETQSLSVEERLKKVKLLFEQGLISKEEHDEKVHEIMKEV